MPSIPTKFRLRQDTAANWALINPVLQAGEPGWETDTLIMRIGDGVSAFTDLQRFVTVEDISDVQANVETALAGAIYDNMGPTAPEEPVAGMRWRDTSVTPSILRVRNDDNDAWVEFLASQGVTTTGANVARASTQLAARQAIGTPTITVSDAAPSGGANGDIWFQY